MYRFQELHQDETFTISNHEFADVLSAASFPPLGDQNSFLICCRKGNVFAKELAATWPWLSCPFLLISASCHLVCLSDCMFPLLLHGCKDAMVGQLELMHDLHRCFVCAIWTLNTFSILESLLDLRFSPVQILLLTISTRLPSKIIV